jgi:hypothetical protein
VARTRTPISGEPAEAPERILAAEYVRMSTEHQQYSTQNQSKTIREYAERRGIEIIKTYSDDAKSGLIIGGRRALQQMISDVESGVAEYRVILVYDVTRWGRFQDADEPAYYEYRCRKAGMQVAYISAILAGTPQAQLAEANKPKRIKRVTPQAVARMEKELARLQEGITQIQDTYGQDHLQLTVLRGFVGKLLGNARVVRYLMRTRPEFLSEFQTIAEMESVVPVEVE